MNKFIDILRLKDVALLELLIAVYPILTVYKYPFLPFSLLFLLIMSFLAYNRKKIKRNKDENKILKFLFIFVLIHEFVLLFYIEPSGLFFSKYIEYIIIFGSILLIYPKVDIRKLEGSINWVAIISIIGLIYHFIQLRSVGEVHQIEIPFFPEMAQDAKLYAADSRPRSFFNEPQHYCSFMLIPQFFSLMRKGTIVWTVIIVISIFLSTSTYGIVASILMLGVYTLSQKMTIFQRIGVVIISISLIAFLLTSSLFEKSVEKIENTDVERSSRIYNGPALLINMPKSDMVFGVPNLTVSDYYFTSALPRGTLIEKKNDIYLPSFYLILAKFGVFGLLLYLLSYYWPMREKKSLLCIGIPLFSGLFSNPDALGSAYAFNIIIMYSFAYCDTKSIPK